MLRDGDRIDQVIQVGIDHGDALRVARLVGSFKESVILGERQETWSIVLGSAAAAYSARAE